MVDTLIGNGKLKEKGISESVVHSILLLIKETKRKPS